MKNKHTFVLACVGFAVAGLVSSPAAVTWHDVQFGGFLSQGYLVNTGGNDYLGDTSQGTFDFREYAANASYSLGKWRIGAQVFGQKLGDYGNDRIKLDWASIDYQPFQWFGVRAGRIKMPRGLYNEALDLDSVRPFVLLPQSVYDARLRDFNSAFNGGMIYGNVELHRLGSLDYKAFIGDIPMSTSSGANDYFNNDAPFPNVAIGMDSVRGGSLFWNPPVSGLRLGYSYNVFVNLSSDRLVPLGGGTTLSMFKTAPHYERHILSAEYSVGDWVFAGEVGREQAHYNIGIIGAPEVLAVFAFESTSGYLSATRRINRWLEVGAYYSHSKDRQYSVAGTPYPIPDLTQDDYALSAKFDITEHLLFKIEGHAMHGSGKIFDTPSHPQPLALRDNSWQLLAAKLTYSF